MSWLIDFFGTIWMLLPQSLTENLCRFFEENGPDIGKCVQRVRYTYFLYRRTGIAYETSSRGLVLAPALYVMKRLYKNRAYKIIENQDENAFAFIYFSIRTRQ